jgi:hypothetical protein
MVLFLKIILSPGILLCPALTNDFNVKDINIRVYDPELCGIASLLTLKFFKNYFSVMRKLLSDFRICISNVIFSIRRNLQNTLCCLLAQFSMLNLIWLTKARCNHSVTKRFLYSRPPSSKNTQDLGTYCARLFHKNIINFTVQLMWQKSRKNSAKQSPYWHYEARVTYVYCLWFVLNLHCFVCLEPPKKREREASRLQ